MMPPDRILKMFNELKPFLYGNDLNENSNLLDVTLEFTNRGQYELRYLIKRQYNNHSLLYEAIVDSTEKLNEWYNFSQHGDDFRVIISFDECNSVFNYSFFDLIWAIDENKYSHISGHGSDVKELLRRDESRYQRYREWRVERRAELRRLKMLKAHEERERQRNQKGFFGRIKEKLLSL